MKPFPVSGLSRAQRVFNYRLSRRRRISENGLGIIGNRRRVFRAPILLPPDKVIALIMVALVLHNFLRQDIVNYLLQRLLAKKNRYFEVFVFWSIVCILETETGGLKVESTHPFTKYNVTLA